MTAFGPLLAGLAAAVYLECVAPPRVAVVVATVMVAAVWLAWGDP